jgi:hypothetical protein
MKVRFIKSGYDAVTVLGWKLPLPSKGQFVTVGGIYGEVDKVEWDILVSEGSITQEIKLDIFLTTYS